MNGCVQPLIKNKSPGVLHDPRQLKKMITKIVKWDNGNGHSGYKMQVTSCFPINKRWPVPVGWKPKTAWEKHLLETIREGCGFIDLYGFGFWLKEQL